MPHLFSGFRDFCKRLQSLFNSYKCKGFADMQTLNHPFLLKIKKLKLGTVSASIKLENKKEKRRKRK